MALTLNQLYEIPEFQQGSYDRKQQMFEAWKEQDFKQWTAGQDEITVNSSLEQAENDFLRVNPEPESDMFSDALNNVQVGLGSLQALGAELGRQIPYVEEVNDYVAEKLGMATLSQEAENAKAFSEKQMAQLSPYAKDKELQKAEQISLSDGEIDQLLSVMKFYVTNPGQITQATLRSLPVTVATALPAVRAAQISKLAGFTTGAATEGLMTGAEAALQTREEAVEDLVANGFDRETADRMADAMADNAFLKGTAVGVLLSPISETGIAVSALGKQAAKTASEAASKLKKPSVVKDLATKGTGAVIAEGVQGAAVQAVSNDALSETFEVDWNRGLGVAAAEEAIAASPTVTVLQSVGTLSEKQRVDEYNAAVDALAKATEDYKNEDDTSGSSGTSGGIPSERQEPTGEDGETTGRTIIEDLAATGEAIQGDERPIEKTSTDESNASVPDQEVQRGINTATDESMDAVQPNGAAYSESSGSADTQGDGRTSRENSEGNNSSTETLIDINDYADVQFDEMSTGLQRRWTDAIQNKNATIDEAESIRSIHLENRKATRNAARITGSIPPPAKPSKENLPVELINNITSSTPLTVEQRKLVERTGVPGGVTKIVESVIPANVEVSDPKLYPDIKKNLKIADQSAKDVAEWAIVSDDNKGKNFIVVENNQAHVINPRGSVVSTMPFITPNDLNTSNITSGNRVVGKVAVVNTAGKKTSAREVESAVGRRIQKGHLNLSDEHYSKIRSNKGFSGRVYFVNPPNGTDVDNQYRETTPNPRLTKDERVSLPKEITDGIALVSDDEFTEALEGEEYLAESAVTAALEYLEGKPDLAHYREVLLKIQPFVSSVQMVRVAGSIPLHPSTHGYYITGTPSEGVIDGDRVVLANSGLNLHTFTHELVHAATVHVLTEPSLSDHERSKKKSIRGTSLLRHEYAIDELNHIYDLAKRYMPGKVNPLGIKQYEDYGMTNLREFVAEVFTNPNFKDRLDTIITEGVRGKKDSDSLMGRFMQAIKQLLGIKDYYYSDQAISMIDTLFVDSRYVADNQFSIKGGTNYKGNYDDKMSAWFGNESEGANIPTRYRITKAFVETQMWLREKFVDTDAPFLRLLLKNGMNRGGREFDDIKLFKLRKAISGVAEEKMSQMGARYIRPLKKLNNELADKYSSLGFTHTEIREIFGQYATANHIGTATQLVRDNYTSELLEHIGNAMLYRLTDSEEKAFRGSGMDIAFFKKASNKDIQVLIEFVFDYSNSTSYQAKRVALGSVLEQLEYIRETYPEAFETAGDIIALDAAIVRQTNIMSGFEKYQDTGTEPKSGYKREWTQGGLTVKNARRFMDEVVNKLSDRSEFKVSEVRKDFEDMKNAYVSTSHQLVDEGLALGLYTLEQVDDWKESGLYDDFIPFSGKADSNDDSKNGTGFQGNDIDVKATRYRGGRTSASDDAFTALSRRMGSMATEYASQPFNEEFARSIQRGDIFNAHIVTVKNSKQGVPENAVRATLDGKPVAAWVEDQKVMEALRLNGKFLAGEITRKLATFTAWGGRWFTYLKPMFAPKNFMMDFPERVINLASRKIFDTEGNKISGTGFAIRAHKYVADPRISKAVGKIYLKRNFGQEASFDSSATVNNKDSWEYYIYRMRELGALSTYKSEYNRYEISDDKIVELTQRYDAELKAALSSQNGKEAKKILKGALKDAAAGGLIAKDGVVHLFNIWNEIWDARVAAVTFRTLIDMGVSEQDAAFRVRDTMNFDQKGRWTDNLRAFAPFINPKFQGSANLLRSVIHNPKAAIPLLSARIAFYTMLYQMASAMAGSWGDDDEEIGNKIDAIPFSAIQSHVPFMFADKTVRLPVGYGLDRVAWHAAVAMNRNDTLDYKPHSIHGAVWEALFHEMSPFLSEMRVQEGGKGALDALTPFLLKPLVQAAAGTNRYGNMLDGFIQPGMPTFAADKVNTEETYKKWAKWATESFGYEVTPQQMKHYATSYAWGVGAPLLDIFVNERGLKEKKEDLRDSAMGGIWNMLGGADFIRPNYPPETNVYWAHTNKVVEEAQKYVPYDRSKKTKEAYDFTRIKADAPHEVRETIQRDMERVIDYLDIHKRFSKISRRSWRAALLRQGVDVDGSNTYIRSANELQRETPDFRKINELKSVLHKGYLSEVRWYKDNKNATHQQIQAQQAKFDKKREALEARVKLFDKVHKSAKKAQGLNLK